jgi:hypothetical protein
MNEDGLDSVIFRISRNIESFWDFTKDMIVDPGIGTDEIKRIIEKRYPELKWSDEGHGVYFGSVPCEKLIKVGRQFAVEVWLHEKPCCIFIDGGYAIDVKAIATDLDMVAFDVLGGDRIYP